MPSASGTPSGSNRKLAIDPSEPRSVYARGSHRFSSRRTTTALPAPRSIWSQRVSHCLPSASASVALRSVRIRTGLAVLFLMLRVERTVTARHPRSCLTSHTTPSVIGRAFMAIPTILAKWTRCCSLKRDHLLFAGPPPAAAAAEGARRASAAGQAVGRGASAASAAAATRTSDEPRRCSGSRAGVQKSAPLTSSSKTNVTVSSAVSSSSAGLFELAAAPSAGGRWMSELLRRRLRSRAIGNALSGLAEPSSPPKPNFRSSAPKGEAFADCWTQLVPTETTWPSPPSFRVTNRVTLRGVAAAASAVGRCVDRLPTINRSSSACQISIVGETVGSPRWECPPYVAGSSVAGMPWRE